MFKRDAARQAWAGTCSWDLGHPPPRFMLSFQPNGCSPFNHIGLYLFREAAPITLPLDLSLNGSIPHNAYPRTTQFQVTINPGGTSTLPLETGRALPTALVFHSITQEKAGVSKRPPALLAGLQSRGWGCAKARSPRTPTLRWMAHFLLS